MRPEVYSRYAGRIAELEEILAEIKLKAAKLTARQAKAAQKARKESAKLAREVAVRRKVYRELKECNKELCRYIVENGGELPE